MELPKSPPRVTKTDTTSPTSREESIVDPRGYIAPDQQDMLFSDITSEILHADKMTRVCGRGNAYLSDAVSFPEKPWPATGIFYGINHRLMINLVCQRAKRREHPIRHVFFLVDTGSPYSYLCPEAMGAILPEGSNVPDVMNVWIHSKDQRPFQMHMSPQGTRGEPGKFRDVNLLGMDFILRLSMTVDGTLNRFKLFQPDDNKLLEDEDFNEDFYE
jgi:hypothetical protein